MLTLKIDPLMPSSHVSELGALFLMILHPECRTRGMTHLKEEDFHFHKLFFRVLKEMHEGGGAVTDMIFFERVSASVEDERERANAQADLVDVLTLCDVPCNFDTHLETLIDTSTRRQLHFLAAKLQDESVERLPEFSSKELIDSAEQRIRALRHSTTEVGNEADIRDMFAQFEDDYASKGDERVPGRDRSVPTGLKTMDAENRGPFGSELVVIAARPSVGKTALGIQACLAAASDNAPAYIFSFEMNQRQVRDRAIAHLSGIPINRVRDLNFQEGDLDNYTIAKDRFKGVCRVNFKTGLTFAEICENARVAHRVIGCRLIMIDYLALIRPTGKFQKTYESIGEITRELKLLALELNVPVLLLAQLNRESEKLDREPKLSDLAASGNIEQDADQVWMLHAPDGIDKPARTLRVAKGRNTGAGFKLDLQFAADIQLFTE